MIKMYCDRCGMKIDESFPKKDLYFHYFYKVIQFDKNYDGHKNSREIHLCPACENALTLWLHKED